MSDNRIETILIAGGGIAGWMAAATLARALGRRARIRVIETAQNDPGVPESEVGTLPPLRALHGKLGIDEYEFMRGTGATFRLGTAFEDWSRKGHIYFHGLGETGASLESVGFRHLWLKLRQGGDDVPLSDFSLAATAAKGGRFSKPSSDARSVLSTMDYGYHLDTAAYARGLRAVAEKFGVERSDGKIASVELRGEDGFIQAVVLEGGQRIEADLFLDCTGTEARLIGDALKTPFEDWSRWLPCDRMIAVSTAAGGDLLPYTIARARDAGWQWRIPLQNRVGHAYLYSSRHASDDEAAAALLSSTDGEVLGAPRSVPIRSGRRSALWAGNCIALGTAAGYLDPTEPVSLYLAQSGIARLLALFPDKNCNERVEYNRLGIEEFERIRDFLVLHYKATARGDTAFWRECRDMEVPDTLAYKMRLFHSRGRVVLLDSELFSESDWASVFIGQDIVPDRYDPVADGIDVAQLRLQLQRMRSAIRQAAESMPAHRAFVAKYCAMPGVGAPRAGVRT